MGNILKNIWLRALSISVKYRPLIEVRIFKSAILHNLDEFQKNYSQVQFAPVIKSNAYGHGIKQMAKILDNKNCPFFIVDSFYEALVLKREGIKTQVLILGYATMEQINNRVSKEVSFAIIDLSQLKNIADSLKNKTNFHLKIDTGMHRQGIMPADLDKALEIIKSNQNINIVGACSHFADADGGSSEFTLAQIQEWNKIALLLKKEFVGLKFLHLANTAGTYFGKEIIANVSRLGLGLYGINTSPYEKLKLKPALEMGSMITSIKNIPAGEKVGYNITYESKQPMVVATVPVGYNEGVDRRLSNIGGYVVGGIYCPLVGRVSMNISSVDVTAVKDIKLEDEVIIISANPEDKNSVENIAKQCGTIPYEIFVHIPQHLRRAVIIEELKKDENYV